MYIKSALVLCLLAVSGALASAGVKGTNWSSQETLRATKTHEELPKIQQLEQEKIEAPKRIEQQQHQERLEQQQQQQQQREDESEVQTSRIEQQQVIEQQPLRIEQARQDVAEPEPYSFGYSNENSARSESGDARGVVRGFYRINGPEGSRLVEYIADENGFRANINTNEFGTESRSPANVELHSSQPLAKDLALEASRTSERLAGTKSSGWIEQATQRIELPERKLPALPLPAAPVAPVAVVRQEPIKGEPERKIEQVQVQQHLLEQHEEQREAPIKGELRTGKTLQPAAAPRPAASFESASAHRESAVKGLAPTKTAAAASWKGQPAIKSSPLRSVLTPVHTYRRLSAAVAPAGGISFYNLPSHDDGDFDLPSYLH